MTAALVTQENHKRILCDVRLIYCIQHAPDTQIQILDHIAIVHFRIIAVVIPSGCLVGTVRRVECEIQVEWRRLLGSLLNELNRFVGKQCVKITFVCNWFEAAEKMAFHIAVVEVGVVVGVAGVASVEFVEAVV